jgi:hypothetical protein
MFLDCSLSSSTLTGVQIRSRAAVGNLDGSLTLKAGPRRVHEVELSWCTTRYQCFALANVFHAVPNLVTEGSRSLLKGCLRTGICLLLKEIASEKITKNSEPPLLRLQVTVRIGRPITGYGSESRNRAARQRIRHNITKDEDGEEHVQVSYYVEMLAVRFLLLRKGVGLCTCSA